ncbi:type VI secretion system baseplate subunit TssG [Niabella insulamsoli]|uniref:type VI secretion system baseplate subunit TssG n=1 Tax=Niabella insulamsoli TaxID=3144874 RepID=UPI0031FC3889
MSSNNLTAYSDSSSSFLAEAVCASLIEQGLSFDHIDIELAGAFKKKFSPDVERVAIDESPGGVRADIKINRDGFYDILPEGLFHQTRGMQVVRNVQDAVLEHRKYKDEERQARKFFNPLEEMIFKYRVWAELSERKALFKEQSEQLVNELFEFWNIEKTLPRREALRMIALMPYLRNIKGDKQATADALAFILNRNVVITDIKKRTVSARDAAPAMQNMRLGHNTVLGNHSNEVIYAWQVDVEGVAGESVGAFVAGAPKGKLLKRFAEIFIPIERDLFFEFDLKKPEGQQCNYILGYGCAL